MLENLNTIITRLNVVHVNEIPEIVTAISALIITFFVSFVTWY